MQQLLLFVSVVMCVVFLASTTSAYTAEPSASYTGVITGSVFDSNYVDVTGANVTLWQNGSMVDTQNNPQQSNHGNNTTRFSWVNNKTEPYITSLYRFDHLAPGQYQVISELEGHTASANVSVDNNTTIANLTFDTYLIGGWDAPTPPTPPATTPYPSMPKPTPFADGLTGIMAVAAGVLFHARSKRNS